MRITGQIELKTLFRPVGTGQWDWDYMIARGIASRNDGSGSGDMYAYIPTSDFAGSKTSDFVYLYAHFGNTDASQAGFEEWALVNVAPIPEMNALFPIIGFFALAFVTQHLRRRHAREMRDI